MSDITTLDDDAVQAIWQRLLGALLSGAHPEDGDPVTPGVAWAVYEEHDVFGPDFHARLLEAVGEGGAITALEYYDDGSGGITVAGGVRLTVPGDADAWYDLAMESNVGINGMGWILSDDSATWVAMTVVDVQLVAATADAAKAWFGSRADAERRRAAFAEAFDSPDRGEPFQRLVGFARVPAG